MFKEGLGRTDLPGGDGALIKESINQFLNRRGVNRRLVEDTYDIMLILFIIDAKGYNLENYLPKIKGMLEILPLFEEETHLIEFKN